MTPAGAGRTRLAALAAPFLLGLAVLVAVGVPAPAATAASNGAFSIFPYRAPGSTGPGRPLFDFSLKAGHEARDAFTLANDSPQPLEFDIYPADAYDITAGGGFALRGYGQKNVEVGSWITLPKSLSSTYRLAADTQVTIPFTVSVPADATPGDHAGGIVALEASPSNGAGSGVHFSVRQGVGVRVYLHVLGRVHPRLVVEDLKSDASVPPGAFLTGSSRAGVTFDVVDTGNTIYPSVSVRAFATNVFGQKVRTFRTVHLAAVLPGSREAITEPEWSPLPLAGPVTVHVQLVATRVDHKYTSSFWVVPWLLIAMVLVVLVALAAVLRRRRKARPRHARGGHAEPPAQEPGDATTSATEAEESPEEP
jgi:hypothetical protein